jgi:RNA polymerase sigma-70 factor, ECF subfamily
MCASLNIVRGFSHRFVPVPASVNFSRSSDKLSCMRTERSNEEWVKLFQQSGPETDAAYSELRLFLVRGLQRALQGRPTALELAEDFAQDSMLHITRNLSQFRGDSRFTTWALAIAIRVAFNEMRRSRWRDVSLDALMGADGFASAVTDASVDDPERSVAKKEILEKLDGALRELTPKQRQILMGELRGIPQQQLAVRMGMTRNALYKLGHDGRKRMKQTLLASGLSWDQLDWALQPEGD